MFTAKTLILAAGGIASGKILNKITVLAILLAFFVAATISSTPAHAQIIGTVCGFSFNSATSCPTAPPNIVAAAGTNITVTFFIQGSDALNGVDMSVSSNPTILNPVLSSFCTGSTYCNVPSVTSVVAASPLVLIDCINGAPVANSGGACNPYDGNGIASVGLLNLGGSTIAPTTGLIFTVTFHVISTTPTAIDVLVNSANCTNQSIAGTSDCILVTNGAAVDTELLVAGASVGGTTDAAAMVTVNNVVKDNTSTTVACNPSTVVPSGTSSCTATVADTTTPSNTPSGSVSFTATAGTIGASCTLTAGACAVSFTAPATTGPVTVNANYGGDGTHNGSSGSTTVNVAKDNTSTTVACTPASINIGGASTCTATVADTTTPANTPSGSVSFTSSNTAVGTVGASCTLVSGSCSVTFTGVAPGTATVTGTYGGDAQHNGSSGTSGTITVVKDNTSTTVACTPSSINVGQTSTCTATVTDTTTASNTPTGMVTFTSSNTAVGTVIVSCTLALNNCSVTFTGVGAGTATVTGTYGGDTTHNGSSGTSNTITVSVVKDNTSTTVTVMNGGCNVALGSTSCSTTVTAMVVDTTNVANTPTGTVTFSLFAGGTGGSLNSLTCTLLSGSCSVMFTGTTAGSGSVTATYGGDAIHNGSTSAAATITVTVSVPDNTSTSVVCSPSTIVLPGASICTATVTDTTNAANTPTGTVSFVSSNVLVGTVGASCTLSLGSCSVTFTGVAAGSATVTGTYGGDVSHNGSSGTSNTISVLSPVVFFGGKLSWTHHLSLSKTTCSCETWTIKISNPNTVTVYAQVTIVATDGTGTTGFTAMSAIITLTAGQSLTPTMQSPSLSSDVGVKFHFTATIMWGTDPTALTFPGGNTKSGSFAVVA